MPTRSSARCLALALALLGAPAVAGELDVSVQAGDRPVRAMTWLEVTAGPVPALRFRADDGTPHRLEVDVRQAGDDRVELAVKISSIDVRRNGTERVRLVSDAVLETSDGQPATLEMTLPAKAAGRLAVVITPRLSAERTRPPMFEPAEDRPNPVAPPAPTEPTEAPAAPEAPAID